MSEVRWWLTPRGIPWVLAVIILATLINAGTSSMPLADALIGALWASCGATLGMLILSLIFGRRQRQEAHDAR